MQQFSINQSINQSISQSVQQFSINQSVDQSINQSVCHCCYVCAAATEPAGGMQQLEARARQLAEESLKEKAAAEKKLLFVR